MKVPKRFDGYNGARMRDFWWFIFERQNIYVKRQQNEPRPWTEDPILHEYFFTNVYRELDKGTVNYMQMIEYYENDATLNDLVFNTLIYRLINRIDTLAYLGFIDYGRWHFSEQLPRLQAWEGLGNKTFTDAFTVTGVRYGDFDDKLSNIVFLIDELQDVIPSYVQQLVEAKSLEDIFKATAALKGFGAFLAYEVTIDLNYWFSKYSEDDFVNVGPGCKEGLSYIWGKQKGSFYLDALSYLRRSQVQWFEEFGFDFTFLVEDGKEEVKELSLRNIEHSLCEYSKYARVKLGIDANGKATRTTTRRFRGPGAREAQAKPTAKA